MTEKRKLGEEKRTVLIEPTTAFCEVGTNKRCEVTGRVCEVRLAQRGGVVMEWVGGY